MNFSWVFHDTWMQKRFTKLPPPPLIRYRVRYKIRTKIRYQHICLEKHITVFLRVQRFCLIINFDNDINLKSNVLSGTFFEIRKRRNMFHVEILLRLRKVWILLSTYSVTRFLFWRFLVRHFGTSSQIRNFVRHLNFVPKHSKATWSTGGTIIVAVRAYKWKNSKFCEVLSALGGYVS